MFYPAFVCPSVCLSLYVSVCVCLSVCLFVCLSATSRKNCWLDLRENFTRAAFVDKEKLIKFWDSCASGSGSRNFLEKFFNTVSKGIFPVSTIWLIPLQPVPRTKRNTKSTKMCRHVKSFVYFIECDQNCLKLPVFCTRVNTAAQFILT